MEREDPLVFLSFFLPYLSLFASKQQFFFVLPPLLSPEDSPGSWYRAELGTNSQKSVLSSESIQMSRINHSNISNYFLIYSMCYGRSPGKEFFLVKTAFSFYYVIISSFFFKLLCGKSNVSVDGKFWHPAFGLNHQFCFCAVELQQIFLGVMLGNLALPFYSYTAVHQCGNIIIGLNLTTVNSRVKQVALQSRLWLCYPTVSHPTSSSCVPQDGFPAFTSYSFFVSAHNKNIILLEQKCNLLRKLFQCVTASQQKSFVLWFFPCL